jgi:hypothetical protein
VSKFSAFLLTGNEIIAVELLNFAVFEKAGRSSSNLVFLSLEF